MLAQERRDLILQDLRRLGGIETEEVAKQYDVSVETVRRDLVELEKSHLLKRVYGGAVSTSVGPRHEPPHSERESVAADQKQAIAVAAASLIPDDATVFLDLGTTVEALARQISDSFAGTIVTSSLRAVGSLARLDQATIIVTGGKLRKSELSLSGSMATSFLDGFFPDVAIISIGAFAPDSGVTDFDFDELHVKQSVLANSKMSVIVADSTKFGKTAPFKLCDVGDPSHVVTDRGLKPAHVHSLQERGAHVLLA